jgi:hypothetical protein
MFRDVAIPMVGLNIRAITPDVAIATEAENTDGFRTPDGTEVKAGLDRLTFVLVKCKRT